MHLDLRKVESIVVLIAVRRREGTMEGVDWVKVQVLSIELMLKRGRLG